MTLTPNRPTSIEIIVESSSPTWHQQVSPETIDALRKIEAREQRREFEKRERAKRFIAPEPPPKKKPGRKPGTVSPMKGRSYAERFGAPRRATTQRVCMSCEKTFNSEGKHNRMCGGCRHLSEE